MDMYARVGECWKAQEILHRLQESSGKPDLVYYNTFIKGFCRKGLVEDAIKTFSEVTSRGIQPCIVTYNTFIAGFSARGLFTEANEVISFMIQHNFRPNELTYNTIIDGYCPEQLNHSWVVEFDTSTFYSISLYKCTITTRDESGFGELKLALRVRGLLVTTHDYTKVLLTVAGTTQANSTSTEVATRDL
ncbi:Hypothetical predicted protein [Olea europaea subsp. europaea]|uniref:Pentatricopeptide repeat-containing protein n=1 Tax=Olea europaea subsp. europaea TaxID=158383 RepID=A0A8S0TDD4_OLEEU|nr:Hypothetical predicted protein [Olea europaea subsp. europaea]